ncbi:MAG: preprotein translocase subunit SecA [Clostridia bacterium]|jgi:preprotein translocase subunit SecA|nr:preprotein translocase subunit SecA [Clostridia bacterium]
MKGLIEKIIGTYSQRELRKINKSVELIEKHGEAIKSFSDDELKGKTEEFKNRLKNGETLDELLPEAFAVVREAAERVIGERPYRTQLVGGIVIHQGRIAEMKTGEGKTLVTTLPTYLNALTGDGVHVVTVNDYLSKRNADWMGEIYRFLGLSVGCILNGMPKEEKQAAYNADITYGTNNEFGFDYLRDNMVISKADKAQRKLNYCIVDEVDSVLIDEARTPLIISGPGNKSTELYKLADMLVRRLEKGELKGEITKFAALTREEIPETGDYIIDEKASSANLTAQGVEKAEKFFKIDNLSDPENSDFQHHINNALRAHNLMLKDVNYIVKGNEVVIVDDHTGRLMPGRRYSNGLHQAIEAKEGLSVKSESKTYATITFQNYFNRYSKLSGMTGTALTEEEEFREIYGMDVIEVPTNRPIARVDMPDVIYKNKKGKYDAIVKEVMEANKTGQPVLVGTIAIETSELLSSLLSKKGIKHKVLNAKYHEQEAEIVAAAGQKGAITIATNMAGRGTDIKLGEGVKEIGGLKVIGTERHESRRIDNQLRGRSGRQGDPGESRFFISLEDDLMRLFGGERILRIAETLNFPEDMPLEQKMLSNAIESAQKKVEGNNFEIRKNLLEYDRVMNDQREVIYEERNRVLEGEDIGESILNIIDRVLDNAITPYVIESDIPEEWDLISLREAVEYLIPFRNINISKEEILKMNREDLKNRIKEIALKMYEARENEFSSEVMREIERRILLGVVDNRWIEHIDNMDRVKQGIGFMGVSQKNPVIEYRFIASDMFEELIMHIEREVVRELFHVKIERAPENRDLSKEVYENNSKEGMKKPIKNSEDKVGRNDMCPCGSGKKYKQCCGKE